MPRILTGAGIAVALLVAPSLAFAAATDVTLTTDTVLSVAGVTLNVSGSSASVESITVNAGNFSVTLPVGSSIQVTAPNLNRLSSDTNSGLSSDVCNASQSKLGFAAVGSAVTVTITPSTTLCSSGGSGSSAPSGGSSSSSSSSSSAVTPTPATPATPAATTPAATVTTTTPATPASGLSATQIQSILDVLASFDAGADIIAQVRAALEGGTTTGSVTSAAVQVFKANLTIGSLGSEVKALQQFLNSHGYPVAASGAGSPGKETTKFGALTKAALIKYQKAKSITPAVGYFGPVTRAAMNAD